MLGIPTAEVFTALLLLSQLHGVASEEKDSTDGPLLQYKVLLRHSGGVTAEWFNRSSGAALRAAHLAASHINNASSLSFTMQLVELSDGELGPSDDSVVAIASAECTNETCHAYSKSHGLPMVSFSPSCLVNSTQQYEESSTSTGDQKDVFCMLPSLSHYPVGIAALIDHYGWQRVSVISQAEDTIAASADDIHSSLQGVNISDIQEPMIPTTSHELPSDILDRDYRIVILNLRPSSSRRVLCRAIQENFSRHVFIVPGWYPDTWWEQQQVDSEGEGKDSLVAGLQQSQSYNCSDRKLEMFVKEGKLHVLSLLQSPSPGKNSNLFGDVCKEYANDGSTCSMYGDLAYDAIWTIGQALTVYESTGELSLVNSNFTGVTGQVVFDSTGHRVLGYYSLSQLRYTNDQLKHTPVAKVTKDKSETLQLVYVSGESELSVWPDGVPPDGTPLEEMKHPLLYLVIIYFIMSGIVILWAVVCCIFNIVFRNKKLIKLTSPTLNIMIAIGVILMNLATPLVMHPEAFESGLAAMCIIRSYLLPLGWSLSLCTITVKMWRVFIIYRTTNKLQSLKHKRMRKFLQDKYMVALVICMVIVDIIITTTGVSIPASRFVPERVPDQEFPPYRNSDDIQVMYYNYQCSSEKGLIWVTILFGYKILFLVSGMVLAFLTRKVKVRGLNESREVQVVMIMITPIAIGSLVLRLALRDYLNVVGSVYALSASIFGGIMLCIIFIPKMIYLCKNPSGDQIYISKYNTEMPTNSSIGRCERSLTKTSFVSFDPTSSLKSLLRRASSLDSGMGSSAGPEEVGGIFERGKTTTLSRHVLFALPTIEEGDCSNDVTTTDYSDGAFEANPFIEDKENSNFTEDSVGSPSPTMQPIILSRGITRFQRTAALRHSWHDTPHHHINNSTQKPGGHHLNVNGRLVPSKVDLFGLASPSTKPDRMRLVSYGSLPSLNHLDSSGTVQTHDGVHWVDYDPTYHTSINTTIHNTSENHQATHQTICETTDHNWLQQANHHSDHTTESQHTSHHTTENQHTSHHTTHNQHTTHQTTHYSNHTTDSQQTTHQTTQNQHTTHHTTHKSTDNHYTTHDHPPSVFQSIFDSSGITQPRTRDDECCTLVEDSTNTTYPPSITLLTNHYHNGSRDDETARQDEEDEEKMVRGVKNEDERDNKIGLEPLSILMNQSSPTPVALECNA